MCGLYSVVKAMVNDNSEIRNKRLKYYNFLKSRFIRSTLSNTLSLFGIFVTQNFIHFFPMDFIILTGVE